MKKLTRLTVVMLVALIAFTSCNKDKEKEEMEALEVKTISNLHAPGGGYGGDQPPKYFSLETGKEVASKSGDWDIAFSGGKIFTNSGVSGSGKAKSVMLTGTTFAEVKKAPVNQLKEDTAEALAAGKWYNYDIKTHTLTPVPGSIIVVKTNRGNYAKIEIQSFYKDKVVSIDNSYYYTFIYKITKNGSTVFEK